MKKKSGSILIITLMISAILSAITLFLFSIANTEYDYAYKKIRNEQIRCVIDSAQNDAINKIKLNINQFIAEKNFKFQNSNIIDKFKYEFTVDWKNYPELLTLKIAVYPMNINSKIAAEIIETRENYILIESPLIYSVLANDKLIVKNNLSANIALKAGNIEGKSKINFDAAIFTNDGKENTIRSYNNSGIDFLNLQSLHSIAEIKIAESYIAYQNFQNKVIFCDGDLTARNCVFDSCMLIVTGNLTFEENAVFTQSVKPYFDIKQSLLLFETIDDLTQYADSTDIQTQKIKLADPNSQSSQSSLNKNIAILCAGAIIFNLTPDNNILSGVFAAPKITVINIQFSSHISFIANLIEIF